MTCYTWKIWPPSINIVCYWKSDLYHPHISRKSSLSYYWSYWWHVQPCWLSPHLLLICSKEKPHQAQSWPHTTHWLPSSSHHTVTTAFAQSSHCDHCLHPVIKLWSRWATAQQALLNYLPRVYRHTSSLKLSSCLHLSIFIKDNL